MSKKISYRQAVKNVMKKHENVMKSLAGLEYGKFYSGKCSVCGKISTPVYHNYKDKDSKNKVVCTECAPLLSLQQASVLEPYIDLTQQEQKDFRNYEEQLKKKSPDIFRYRDNFRIARITEQQQVDVYQFAKKEGFNGFYDENVTLGNEIFMIGWNYD